MKRVVLVISILLGTVLGVTPTANAGGTGDFYKRDYCSPFLESRPSANVTNYDYGSGQQVHYRTESRWPWYAHAVYAEGIKLSGPSEGFYNWPTRSTTLDTKHVWRNSVTGQIRSCTNVT